MQVLLKTDLIFVEIEIASGPISHTTHYYTHMAILVITLHFFSLSSALPPEWVSVIMNLVKEWTNHPHCSYFGKSFITDCSASADQPLFLFKLMKWSQLEQLQSVIPNRLSPMDLRGHIVVHQLITLSRAREQFRARDHFCTISKWSCLSILLTN